MRVLYILLPILLFLLLLLFSCVRFTFVYDGGIRCYVRYLAFCIPIYPRKPRKKKKKKKKAANKSHVFVKKKETAPKHKASPKKESPPIRLGDIRLLLRLAWRVLSTFLEKASHHVRIRVTRLYITIGGGKDAAMAAIEYGVAAQSVSYLLELLHQTGYLKPPKKNAIGMQVNFIEERHHLDIKASVECPLFFLVPLLFSTLTDLLQAKSTWTHHRARAAKKKQQKEKKKENENG